MTQRDYTDLQVVQMKQDLVRLEQDRSYWKERARTYRFYAGYNTCLALAYALVLGYVLWKYVR